MARAGRPSRLRVRRGARTRRAEVGRRGVSAWPDSIPSLSMSSVAACTCYRALFGAAGRPRADAPSRSPDRCRSGCSGWGSCCWCATRPARSPRPAGLLGAFSLANACGAVAQGRLMDRLGQGRGAADGGLASFPSPGRAGESPRTSPHAPAGVLVRCSRSSGGEARCRSSRPRSSRCGRRSPRSDAQRETAYARRDDRVRGRGGDRAGDRRGDRGDRLARRRRRPWRRRSAPGSSARVHLHRRLASAGAASEHEVGWLGPLVAPGMRSHLLRAHRLRHGGRRRPGGGARVRRLARGSDSVLGRRAAGGAVVLAACAAGSSTARATGRAASLPGSPLCCSASAPRSALLAPAERLRIARACCSCSPALLFAPTVVDLLDAARHRRAAGHGHRGVRRDDHGDRRRHRGRATRSGGNLVESASYEAAVLAAAGVAAAGSCVVLLRRRTLA